jgi:hypothetical protein
MNKRETELDWCCIRKISQPCLAGIQLSLGSICFPDERTFNRYRTQFHPYGFIVLPPVLDISFDNLLLIDYFLKIVLEKIIERVKLVPCNMLPRKICLR